MKKVLLCVALGVVGVAFLPAAPGGAAVQSVGGQATLVAPPPSVEFKKLESNTQMFVFDEQQDVVTTADLPVDITQPGLYRREWQLTTGTIPAGTTVRSHFVHCDRVSQDVPIVLDGTVVTDTPILGIAVLSTALDATDVLGAPGTVYPTGQWQRELELWGQNDEVVVEQLDTRTVRIHCRVSVHADHVRIITASPERTGDQGCTPGYWKQRHHFDSWEGVAPTDRFETVFGRDAYSGDPTMVQALGTGGGGLKALGRHAAAALLNARSSGVDYAVFSSQVIAKYQAAFDSGDAALVEATKNELEGFNEAGCPLS